MTEGTKGRAVRMPGHVDPDERNRHMPASQRDRATEKLLEAVRAMRDACDDAERAARRDDTTDLLKAQSVLHALAWGFANASGGIESAISHHEYWQGHDAGHLP